MHAMKYDIVCFSHLRWNFVYQRPQHLLSRFAKNSRVFFIEEPVWDVGKDNICIIMLILFQAVLIRNIFLQQGKKHLKKIFIKISLIQYWVFTALLMNE